MIDTLSVSIGERVILLPKGDYYLRYRDRFEVSNEFVIPAKSFRRRPPFRPKNFITEAAPEPVAAPSQPSRNGAQTLTRKKPARAAVAGQTAVETLVPAEMLRGKLIKLDKRKRKRR